MPSKNKTTTLAGDTQLLSGIHKDLLTTTTLPLAGTGFTPTSLSALIQSRIDAANAVMAARASYSQAIATYDALDAKVTPVVAGLKHYVINAFGATSTQLADFGMTPASRAPLTVEQKAAAVAKRAATRKARGTLGSKQKLAVTGETVRIAALENAAASVPAATSASSPAPVPAVTPSTASQPVTK